MGQGTVVSIHIAATAREFPRSVSEVRAVAGMGLEGDRYFSRQGTFSPQAEPAREVTLIEREALEALQRESNLGLAPGTARRNLTTRGVALNHLVNREFRVGEVVLRGLRLCEPCSHLEGLTQPGAKAGLIHRGGLRAQIIQGGIIRVGDIVEEIHSL